MSFRASAFVLKVDKKKWGDYAHPREIQNTTAVMEICLDLPRVANCTNKNTAKNIARSLRSCRFLDIPALSFTQTEYFYRLLRKHVQPESRRMTNE